MKTNYIFIILAVVAAACSASSEKNDTQAKKAELEKSKKQLTELNTKIAQLEKEIGASDPSFTANRNAVLVVPIALEAKPFEHFIDVRGSVKSRKNVLLGAQAGGDIIKVYVREGQRVSKGQILVSLNADILRNSLADLRNSYELAKTIYEKQEKLWQQKIGTEVQYLQAKNNKESLEKKIAMTEAQIDQMIVKAPFSGTVDQVIALEGQIASPGAPLIRIVSSEDMYINADVSEDFIGSFKAGSNVAVYFPPQDKKITTKISSVGQVVNPENRTFELEIKLAVNFQVQPNQIAILTLQDYVNPKAFSVPTKVIQSDNSGQYIYVVNKKGSKDVAHKVYVTTGLSYNGNTEILEGLSASDVVVGEGFRDVAEGVEINLASVDQKNVIAEGK